MEAREPQQPCLLSCGMVGAPPGSALSSGIWRTGGDFVVPNESSRATWVQLMALATEGSCGGVNRGHSTCWSNISKTRILFAVGQPRSAPRTTGTGGGSSKPLCVVWGALTMQNHVTKECFPTKSLLRREKSCFPLKLFRSHDLGLRIFNLVVTPLWPAAQVWPRGTTTAALRQVW